MVEPAPKAISDRHLTYVNCDLCGADDTRTLMRKQAVIFDWTFPIVRCNKCGHVYVNPRLSNDIIDSLYDEEYYQGRGFDRTVKYAEQLSGSGLLEVYRDELLTLREASGDLNGKTVLDLGCGNGGLVRALLTVGAQASGFDTSPYARRLCEEYGTPLAAESLDELYGANNTYDIVSAMEVIEHTFSPLEFLKSVSQLVKPGGILFIETGNWNLVRLDPGTPYLMPEGHIHYLNPTTLKAYFEKAGLETTGTFNYTWAGWRKVGSKLGAPGPALAKAAGFVVRRLAPGVGPFPVGKRPRT